MNPRFQWMFAVYTIVTTLLMVPIFMAANFYFFNLFEAKAYSVGLPPGHELLQFVERQQALIIVVFICATILAIAINLICSLVISHRIAGSMYRLTLEMNSATDIKSAKQIKPRKDDFFQDVTEAYNQLVERSNV